MTHPSRLPRLILAGLLAGFLVLGVGGRILMRILTFTTPGPPRFTIAGTLQVLALGAAWGGLTAPVWLVFRRLGSSRVRVLAHGAVTFAPAAAGFALLATFSGNIVAPTGFLVLGAILFPVLFVCHAGLLEWLATRCSRGTPPE